VTAPLPVIAVPDLRGRALCTGQDPDLWFPKANGKAAAGRAICARCPAAEACLEWALATAEPSGVWGGLDPDERRQVKRTRDRLGRDVA
jgi:WhiB family redox-sensing transcriptional regulator